MGMKAHVFPCYVLLYDVFQKNVCYIYKGVLQWLPMLQFFVLCDVFVHMIYVSNAYLCAIYQDNM
jgi:hypothetical protein